MHKNYSNFNSFLLLSFCSTVYVSFELDSDIRNMIHYAILVVEVEATSFWICFFTRAEVFSRNWFMFNPWCMHENVFWRGKVMTVEDYREYMLVGKNRKKFKNSLRLNFDFIFNSLIEDMLEYDRKCWVILRNFNRVLNYDSSNILIEILIFVLLIVK